MIDFSSTPWLTEPARETPVLTECDVLVAGGGPAGMAAASDISDLEAEFVRVAAGYSERKRVGYYAWRAVGVPASVLKAAGIRKD